MIVGIFAIMWMSIFYNKWASKEVEFAIQYNKGNADEEKYSKTPIRSFDPGHPYERSVINDQMNDKPSNASYTYRIATLQIFLIILLYGLKIAATIGVIYLKDKLTDGKHKGDTMMIFPYQILANAIELAIVLGFNRTMVVLAVWLTEKQKYKFIEDFQKCYINIVVFSQLFSIYFPVIMIVYVKQRLPGLTNTCNGHCETEASFYVAMYFYMKLILHGGNYILKMNQRRKTKAKTYRIRRRAMKISSCKSISQKEVDKLSGIVDKIEERDRFKASKKVGTSEKPTFEFDAAQNYLMQKFNTIFSEMSKNTAIHGFDNRLDRKMYSLLNKEIERQIQMECSESSPYRLHIVDEYLEIFQVICISVITSPVYGLGFFFTWIIVAIEFMNDKEKYLFTKRKLDPQGGGTIGHLNDVMYFVSWLAVLLNVVLATNEIGFQLFKIDSTPPTKNETNVMFFFYGTLITCIIFKYLLIDRLMYGDLDPTYQSLRNRRDYVIASVMNKYPPKLVDVQQKGSGNFFYKLENNIMGLPGAQKPKPIKMKN